MQFSLSLMKEWDVSVLTLFPTVFVFQEDPGLLSHLLEALDSGAPPHGGIALGELNSARFITEFVYDLHVCIHWVFTNHTVST